MRPQLHKGVSRARGDDTRSLKGAILDWIVPIGQTLNLLLNWNKKDDCGFKHEHTGALLCPIDLNWSDNKYVFWPLEKDKLISYTSTKEKLKSGVITVCGDQWPTLLYLGTYNPMDLWNGLLCNNILVKVSDLVNIYQLLDSPWPSGIQVYFHITQLSQCGGQGNPIRQCSYPWYGMRNTWVNHIHCYTGNIYVYIYIDSY